MHDHLNRHNSPRDFLKLIKLMAKPGLNLTSRPELLIVIGVGMEGGSSPCTHARTALSPVLRTFPLSFHIVLTTALGSRHCFYPYFLHRETEA